MRLTRSIAAALLLGATVPAAAAAQSPVGVITHGTDAKSDALLRKANVKHVKTTLYWNAWEDPQPNTYPQRFEDGIKRLAASGFEITVVVHAPPGYRNTYGVRLETYKAFAAFMGARARQFPQVRNWQLFNEQDSPGWTPIFGAGVDSMYQQGLNYGEMLKSASDSIKKANPGALVVVGGLGGPDNQIASFLRGVYDSKAPFDVVATHAYGLPLWNHARIRALALRDVIRRKGGTQPLWLTEFGVASYTLKNHGYTTEKSWDDRQMVEWRDVATWNDTYRYYARLVGYVLFDATDYGYGIVRADTATVRPAYTWLQRRNRQ